MSQADDLQRRCDNFADVSVRFVLGLPQSSVAQRMGGQYQNAATSVAANYRAARHARSRADFVSKLGIVSEEADEAVFWLERFRAAAIMKASESFDALLGEANELARIFSASARTAKRKRESK